AKEVDVVKDAKRRIEIAAEPLRHVRDAAVTCPAMAAIGHVSIEDSYLAALDLAYAGHQCEQRRFADAVRSYHPDHAVGGNIKREVVERDRFSVTVRDTLDPGDDGVGHCGSFTTSSSGQLILVLVRTKPRPRTPVFTNR